MFGNLSLLRPGALPQEPTPALPGTEEKILVLIERASRREQLFHPFDGPGAASRLNQSAATLLQLASASPPVELSGALLVPSCGEAQVDDDEEDADAAEIATSLDSAAKSAAVPTA
jgi:hypothetical protein